MRLCNHALILSFSFFSGATAGCKMAEKEDEAARLRHRQHRGMLKMYYGVGEESGQASAIDPCDINGAHFKPEAYLEKLFKEKSLTELMDKETDVGKQIRALDSDMQTLVYENYNKFISATDTIRKMKHDFKKMEDEMDKLATNMSSITEFSDKISGTLQEKRQQITKLSGVHVLLKKLQFLFELPARLNKCVEMKQYGLAVRYYTKARDVLHQYSHMPSFRGIHQDCDEIVNQLRVQLREQLRNPKSTPKQLTECVDLLLQLQEPADELCDEFLTHARERLDENLRTLRAQVKLKTGDTHSASEGKEEVSDEAEEVKAFRPMDFLEFIDCGCNGFLSTICLVIASYKELFVEQEIARHNGDHGHLDKIVTDKLSSFVLALMGEYFKLIEARIELESDTADNALLVRALDRFHRRLQAVHKLLPEIGVGRSGANIVARAAHSRVNSYTQTLRQQFTVCLTDIRQSLASPRQMGKDKSPSLTDLISQVNATVVNQLKAVLNNLKGFIGHDVTFAVKPYFRGPFCADDVREGLVVQFIRHILHTAEEFCDTSRDKVGAAHPALILLLSRFCLDFQESTISYMLSLTDEQFPVHEKMRHGSLTTSVADLASDAQQIAQDLLNNYVRIQGLTISQMIRKSVETRDWLNTIEPRNVRAVMKRIVEDISSIDSQVGQLYEEGVRKAHSSDSSKFTYSKPSKTQWSFTPSTAFDSSLLSNIQKLFSERIEIFTSVEFSKVSVLTGIIKIGLKTLLECVRLRTFGKYGLQQIQVDTHYLQMYLWRFVSDENLVHFMLDEVVNSVVNRCVVVELMEPSVIEVICERG